jgi:hypothetical protein
VGRCRTALLTLTAAVTAVLSTSTPAGGAPAAGARISPGVLMLSPIDEQTTSTCTAAFVFKGAGSTYLGYAAHCAASGEPTGLSGCVEPTLPLGTSVAIERTDGSRTSGRLAYTSWGTMQERGESDQARCFHNDFALVELDPADAERVDPTVPVLGGPTGLDTDGTTFGDRVVSYQPHGGERAVKQGRSLGVTADGFSHQVDTTPPGRPGDSGGGYLDADGRAFGVLSTLLLDGRGTNGMADLAHALAYANAYGRIGPVALVPGAEPFTPPDRERNASNIGATTSTR